MYKLTDAYQPELFNPVKYSRVSMKYQGIPDQKLHGVTMDRINMVNNMKVQIRKCVYTHNPKSPFKCPLQN